MGRYRCTLVDENGTVTRVEISAADSQGAIRATSTAERIPVSVEEIPQPAQKRRQSRKTSNAVLEFTEMMDLLTDSGLSIKDSLEVASKIGNGSPAGIIASDLAESVRKGDGFAAVIESRTEWFPDIYRGLVTVGDRTGSVERIFPRLAAYLRDMKTLRDKVMGALTYPILVLFVTVAGSIGISLFVLPRIEEMFSGFGGEGAEKIYANMRAMKVTIIAVATISALAVVASFALAVAARRKPSLARALDALKLSLPVIGPFLAAWETLNFAFAMETLAAGGVAVESALGEAARVVSNEAYRAAILDVRSEVLKGHNLSAEFPHHREFPSYLSQWMIVGERSGKTERVFAQVRKYFQAEVDRSSTKFTTLLEPALIVLIGILLLILVTGIVVPLFTIYGSLV